MTRKERITEILSLVIEKVSFYDVFQNRIKELQTKGNNIIGLCPFHNDTRTGGFSANDTKKVWKCFVCGKGGNIISFVRDYESEHNNKCNYVEAGLLIAKDKKIISELEYNSLIFRKFSASEVNDLEKTFSPQKETIQIADEKTLNLIYSYFIVGNQYLDKSTLSEEHFKHLLNVRHLSEEEIKENQYFTFPKRFILRKFLKALEDADISLTVLQKIPGFFFDKIKNNWSFTTIPTSGIGIPIKNQNGNIVAIQIRKDTITEGEQRYIWFSSAFAQVKENLLYGCSSGSPANIIYPKGQRTKWLVITEGHFKALKISQEMNAITISVQGITTWKNLVSIVKNLQKKYQTEKVLIAYDADMTYNDAVFIQAIKMGLTLLELPKSENLISQIGKKIKNKYSIDVFKSIYEILKQNESICESVKFAVWDSECGKGIDDFFENGYTLYDIKVESFKKFFYKYAVFLKRIYTLESETDKMSSDEEKHEIFIEEMLNREV